MPNGTLSPTFKDTATTCTYQWYIADENGKEVTTSYTGKAGLN